MLFAYQRNRFGHKKKCSYRQPYRRTHKSCSYLPHPALLSLKNQRNKVKMFLHLDPKDTKVTDLDYLLNISQLDKATKVLTAISIKLGDVYHKAQSARALGLLASD
jgi:hypothetical protein